MIFKELKLVNFRQFKGENKFIFPVNDKRITLIIARNGVGKTTFLQAFRFCFYGESPNVLKLPKPKDLLNYSVMQQMGEMAEKPLSVQVKFHHNGKDYIAVRTTMFKRYNGNIVPDTKNSDENFELWEETIAHGVVKIEDGLKRIQEMIPTGLSHVYMFDGERVEEPIGSKGFKDALKDSIVGVLGLKKLEQASDFLGNESRTNTVIGQVKAKIKPLNDTEQEVLKQSERAERKIIELKEDIIDKRKLIEQLDAEIREATEAQKSVVELRSLVQNKEIAERKVLQKETDIKTLTKNGNDCAAQLLLELEIAKTYKKYEVFISKEEDQTEVFENLYETVIKDILKRHLCICGREVLDDSHEAHILTSLAVLPHNNANYLNSLKSLFNSLANIPSLKENLEKSHQQLVIAKNELEKLRKEYEQVAEIVKVQEEKAGGNRQVNIEHLRNNKALFTHRIEMAETEIKQNEAVLGGISSKINRINNNNQHNRNVNNSLAMLNQMKFEIESELENKKKIARESIEKNMNSVLAEVMDQHYEVVLDSEYQLTVWKKSTLGHKQDETDVLSTGQNVMMYLSFLRALLMTVEQHAEFNEVQSSGVIMDAALSNLDEEHIKQISERILNSFNQLIFLSFKAQLRNELITGIRNNIACVYELSKDSSGNVVSRNIDIKSVEDFVNEGDEDEQ